MNLTSLRAAHLAVMAVAIALSSCAPAPVTSAGPSTITIAGERIHLDVEGCALAGGSFRTDLPEEATETLVRAAGSDDGGRPVAITARRSRSTTAPHQVQTVEITRGAATGDLEALVLYRAYDADRDRWEEVDADAQTGRQRVMGPLFDLQGPRLRAAGAVVRPDGGQRLQASLDIRCPVEVDDRQAAAPMSRRAAFHAS
jgi:hypothetical protein